ncbi:hypothetical protein WR25_03754 [Diploscapter pachys]|uniref:Beta-catenin-interacting ICAT domain-containing protein n=1 Tax=Diploscapter pachys TaxID=2018661 RepID=A0A2A2LNT0_9BILA|nr:hypothetical protein WR25_03754 [Diploscapter pachys]
MIPGRTEQITQANGLVTVKKSCTSQSFYRFDDGTTNNLLNQCVERSIYQYRYLVKICSDSDYCNSDCGSVNPIVTPLTLPTIPTIPTMPTIAPRGTVICFNCETSDGSDCQTNSCTATYCLYQRRLSGNQMTLKKSCLNEPLVLLDDGTAAQATGVCEIRNTANSQYLIKICDDYNLCNNICDPSQPVPSTIPPQRQPLMSCYSCEGYGVECFSGSCSANYCVFEQQRRLSSGLMYYKKTCSALPYVEYPDGRLSQTVNQCEIRTINDIEYQIKICNSQNNCNVGCNGNGVGGIVTCSQCSAQNQLDCTGTTCQGAYCLFDFDFTILISVTENPYSESYTKIREFLCGNFPRKSIFRSSLEESEYEELRKDTIDQLQELNTTLEKMQEGDMTLIDNITASKLAIRAAISNAFRTPEILALFARRQPAQLRQRLLLIDSEKSSHKLSEESYLLQKKEILMALQQLKEPLSQDESQFVQKHRS